MLKLYIRGREDTNQIPSSMIVDDVEKEFMFVKITGSDEEKQAIKEIDQGEYLDAWSFIDRYGDKRSLQQLSTGCKACLVAINSPGKVIDLMECGFNARDITICLCKDGGVIINDPRKSIDLSCAPSSIASNIRVEFNGENFYTLSTLRHYVDNELYKKRK